MPPRSQSPERNIGGKEVPGSLENLIKEIQIMDAYADMNLGELFATADEVGDKYLSDDEIKRRKDRLSSLKKEIDSRTKQILEKYPLL